MNPHIKDILNQLVVSVLKGVSRLPFPVMYGLSDFMSLVLQYVVKYRKAVILNNLRNAFPDKSEAEIKQIVRKFYVHFCDITLETAKAWSMTAHDFEKRMELSGIEEVNRLGDQGISIIALGMHFNNWEWSAYMQKYLKHKCLVVYNPVRNNDRLEKFLTEMRERWGADTIAVHKSARALMNFHQQEHPVFLGLVGDQRPPVITKFWTTFLNQEACFNSGPEKIARRTNLPVYLVVPEKLKRGHYRMHYVPLMMSPAEMSHEEIMLTYIRAMEKYIREAPEYYLWSHKRWKQKRPEDHPLYL